MHRIFIMLLIMAFGLAGCKGDQPPKTVPKGKGEAMHTIVAVGDSLTAGLGVGEEQSYPALLEKKLQAAGYQYRVINAGVSAETSSGALSRLEWILTLHPDIVILETGANDGLRGIDPKLVEENIRKILKTLADHHVEVLLAGMKMMRNLGPVYVAQFDPIYPRLAGESGVVFMPFLLEGVALHGALNQADGVHPNAAGHEKISENIYPYVLEAIKRREKQ